MCVGGGGGLDNVCSAVNAFHRGPCEGVLLLLQGRGREGGGGGGSVPLLLLVKKHITTCDFL